MKLIDADELKKALRYKALNMTMEEFIDNAPTVCGNNPKWCESCVSKGKCASTRLQGEWISVSERLPEENVCDDGYHEPSERVLIQSRNGRMYTSRYWSRGKKNLWIDLNYPEDIIAWQPLPEPYKEGGA